MNRDRQVGQLRESSLSQITVVTDFDDRTETLTGTLDNVELNREVNYEDIGYRFDSLPTLNSEKHSIKGDFVGQWQVEVVKKGPELPREIVKVQRTARLQAKAQTVRAYEAARKLAGVPPHAIITVHRNFRDEGLYVLDKTTPVEVEFTWEEEV